MASAVVPTGFCQITNEKSLGTIVCYGSEGFFMLKYYGKNVEIMLDRA